MGCRPCAVAIVASSAQRAAPLAGMAALGLGLTDAALPTPAAADMVSADALVQQSTLVIDQQSNVYSFTAPGAGTLYVALQDIVWPAPLSSLGMSVNSASGVLGTMNVAGEIDLTLASGGTYYLDVSGKAGGALDVGLYSVSVNFVPQGAVPLPGTLGLVLGGLLALGAARWWWMRNESFMYAT
jgi:hypothetical protein